jgi:GNAT superfamily N-acetyltransferase
VNIVRVTPQNLWRLQNIERTPNPNVWTSEAEQFLLDGRAVAILRNKGTIMLASEANTFDATDPQRFVGVAISYDDPRYNETTRLGSLTVDHRFRSKGVGRALFAALLDEALRTQPYAIWLVHAENLPMLELSRSTPRVEAEASTTDGYIQFFAERLAD